MILYRLAVLRARALQLYYNIKAFDELPFQLIQGDFEDRRVIVPVPRKRPRQ